MKKELIKKFIDGDSLTNAEVLDLYNWYKSLAYDTQKLGERYHLMWRDMYDAVMRLEGYGRARKIIE